MTLNLDLDAVVALADISVTGKSASTLVTVGILVVAGLAGPLVPILFTNAKDVLRDKNGEVIFLFLVNF